MSKYPKVDIEEFNFYDSVYVVDNLRYNADTLVKFAEKKKYPIFDLPVAGINIEHMPFDVDDLKEFVFQMNRVNNTDLSHPVILDDKGYIADGWHRVCKAILMGETTIPAIRLQEMPKPDGIEKEE